MGLGLVTPHERSEFIGAFDVYVTPELLKVKVPVIRLFTACVRRPRGTHYAVFLKASLAFTILTLEQRRPAKLRSTCEEVGRPVHLISRDHRGTPGS